MCLVYILLWKEKYTKNPHAPSYSVCFVSFCGVCICVYLHLARASEVCVFFPRFFLCVIHILLYTQSNRVNEEYLGHNVWPDCGGKCAIRAIAPELPNMLICLPSSTPFPPVPFFCSLHIILRVSETANGL